MRQRRIAVVLLALSACGSALAQHHNQHDERALREDPRLAPGQIAPVLDGLGDLHHEVTTTSEGAQRFFDQGLRLTYGFNHQEALRAFKEAARLDPDCAMAYWGWALVLGPNLNLPMSADVVPQAWQAMQDAVARKAGVSEVERGLIEALAERFTDDPQAERAPLDAAYAEAMGELYRRFPEDDDVATLYAAAIMNTSPWNYWNKDGSPRGRTATLLDVLEGVIARNPRHIGALHYYIHAVEPVDAARGEHAADLLRGLAPGAGHLVHMPSHIYMQLGRYEESYEANAAASAADEGYITQCRAQGMYPLTYYPHNVHFLAWAALMQGRSADALAAARKVAEQVPHDLHGDHWALYQTFLSMPLYVMVRFGMTDEILAEPEPGRETTYLRAVWHYARGMAYLYRGDLGKARKELKALDRIAADPEAATAGIGFAGAGKLMLIASQVLGGELAIKQGRTEEGLAGLERAVRLEDGLLYNEPPDWYYPVRHNLGAALLDVGRPAEAEVVYWQDLKKNRDNGYALFGLEQSLAAQGRDEDAAEIEARFRRAWSAADVQLTSSRY